MIAPNFVTPLAWKTKCLLKVASPTALCSLPETKTRPAPSVGQPWTSEGKVPFLKVGERRDCLSKSLIVSVKAQHPDPAG